MSFSNDFVDPYYRLSHITERAEVKGKVEASHLVEAKVNVLQLIRCIYSFKVLLYNSLMNINRTAISQYQCQSAIHLFVCFT